MKKILKYLLLILLPFLVYLLSFLSVILLPSINYFNFGQKTEIEAVGWDNNFEPILYLANSRFMYLSLILLVGFIVYQLFKKQKLVIKNLIVFIVYILYYFLAYFAIHLILNFLGFYQTVY